LYPPKFYVNKAPYSKKGDAILLNVDEAFLDENEIALYLIEHNDFFGKINIENNLIRIKGKVLISGEEMVLEIEAETK